MSEKLTVLIIDAGGRGHALGWAVNKSPRCSKLYFMPGNGGTSSLGTNVLPVSWEKLPELVEHLTIDLVIVGPELPLAEGVVDILRAHGVPVVGPTKRAAKLETSKPFAKTLMDDYGIPTAPFNIFEDHARAVSYVHAQNRRLYIKAGGLCAGKGAFPCPTTLDAEVTLGNLMVSKTLGAAGNEVVVEDFLDGDELSVHAFCDGTMHVMAPTTRDHKKLLETGHTLPDGTNPNTGGMGAFGPVPGTGHLAKHIDLIVGRTLWALRDRLIDEAYTGILYPGLMLTKSGPKVLEFNVRGGDPETQVLMRLLKSDPLDLFVSIATGTLDPAKVEWHQDRYAVCVVLVSDGYPGKYEVGFPINGISAAELDADVVVFHAGTKHSEGNLVTSGGRVLNVTATGDSLDEAIERAYKALSHIEFNGMHYRRDIGQSGL